MIQSLDGSSGPFGDTSAGGKRKSSGQKKKLGLETLCRRQKKKLWLETQCRRQKKETPDGNVNAQL